VAWPELSVPVPIVVAAILEGPLSRWVCRCPARSALTVAVKVTDWPDTDGLAVELTDTVVAPG